MVICLRSRISLYEDIFPSNYLYIESAPKNANNPIHKLFGNEIFVNDSQNKILITILIIKEYYIIVLLLLNNAFVF